MAAEPFEVSITASRPGSGPARRSRDSPAAVVPGGFLVLKPVPGPAGRTAGEPARRPGSAPLVVSVITRSDLQPSTIRNSIVHVFTTCVNCSC